VAKRNRSGMKNDINGGGSSSGGDISIIA